MIWTFVAYARSGGTLLNRCFGAMPGVAMLSEVGPFGGGGGVAGNSYRTVWDQALHWFDIQLRSRDYVEAIREMEAVCEARGQHLMVREWTYANFNLHPSPPPYRPPMTLWTLDALRQSGAEVRPFALVRDALDMWRSMGAPEPGPFFRHYRAYVDAVQAEGCPILRFEDFTADPDMQMARLCEAIGLPFSPEYRNFSHYLDVNGDVAANKSGASRRDAGVIAPAKSRPLQAAHAAVLAGNDDVAAVQTALGYPVPASMGSRIGGWRYALDAQVGRRLRRQVRQKRARLRSIERRIETLAERGGKKLQSKLIKPFAAVEAPERLGMVATAVPTEGLFRQANKPESAQLPAEIPVIHDPLPEAVADIDVVIGVFRQAHLANEVVRNFLGLERSLRLHVYIVETSGDPQQLGELVEHPQVTRVYLNRPLDALERANEPQMFASNGAALSAQLGFYLGRARHAFFTHTDMMGYVPDFLSDLMAQAGGDIPLAAYHIRGALPFSAGTLYDKAFFAETEADWLPLRRVEHPVPELTRLASRVDLLNWVDCGEQFPVAAMYRGARTYCAMSRGGGRGYYVDARLLHDLDYADTDALPIVFGADCPSRTDYVRRYPELVAHGAGWRKCFGSGGEVAFIHSGRGTSKKGGRGQFFDFLRAFNDERNFRAME